MTQTKQRRSSATVHDNFFREVFGNIRLAREFLQQWLPSDILSRVDLTHLTALPTSQITQALGGSEAIADLLFEGTFADRAALFYVLIEHKSYPDKFVALQAHVYQAAAWWHYHRQHPRKRLPLIVTLVVHHAATPFSYSTDLRDLIDAPRELVDQVVLKPFQLIDLARLPDDALQGSPALRAVALIMKHIRDKRLDQFLEQNLPNLLGGVIDQDEELALALLKYVLDAGNLSSIDEFLALVRCTARVAPTTLREKVMTLGERLRQEGIKEAHLSVARRLLRTGMDIDFISNVTQLMRDEVVALAREVTPVQELP